MAYADEGVGAPILLVHGWAAHGGFFDDLRARLAQKHRVLTPTLRGHPGSGQGHAPLTIDTLADDTAHFIEALGLKDVIALGWSMGAMALWTAAAKVRFAGLIVEDMGPRLINDAGWQGGLGGNYSEGDVAGTLVEINGDWPAYVARFAPRMFAPGVAPGLISWATAEMSKANPEAMAPFWASMAAQDFRETLARIGVPTLVINGGDSSVYPDQSTQFVARTMPKGERAVIAGVGHVPHLEAPDAFFNLVEAFVRKTRQPEIKSGGAVP
jgi:pimeloyl-ACP methyl ester carboxylesterase